MSARGGGKTGDEVRGREVRRKLQRDPIYKEIRDKEKRLRKGRLTAKVYCTNVKGVSKSQERQWFSSMWTLIVTSLWPGWGT